MSILGNYANPDRYYHNFKHIGLMLDGLDRHFYDDFTWQCAPAHLRRRTPVYEQLKQAIVYHDVIYDARRTDNEERSADCAADELQCDYDTDWIDSVRRLILVTKTHNPQPNSSPEKIIVDLDLAGLASHNYIRHSQQIRKEYAFATDEQWYHGRKAFLDSFLNRESIYHTQIGLRRWEDDARRNMQLELKYIEANIAAL
ncbi:hydrolase [Rhodococcus phage NiceHouse]|nr:hydrolase [Rhodococcus phage NiceHouse]